MDSNLHTNLINKGFTSFNLKDYDITLYNKLREMIPYGETTRIFNPYLHGFFFCASMDIHVHEFFEKLEPLISDIGYDVTSSNYIIEKEKVFNDVSENRTHYLRMYFHSENLSILNKIKEIIFKNFKFDQDQCWFESNVCRPSESNKTNFETELKHILHSIIQKHYPSNNVSRYFDTSNFRPIVTSFPKYSLIKTHKDGENEERLAVILLYLNDDWRNEYGGQLVVENNTIIQPEFGNVAILDFTHNNVQHEVLEVNTDRNRFAYNSFLDIRNL